MTTTQIKKDKIQSLVSDMLEQSYKEMLRKIPKALDSGALDIDEWDPNFNSMILPKIIVTAILKNESKQYEGEGTSFEKYVRKEVDNLRIFI